MSEHFLGTFVTIAKSAALTARKHMCDSFCSCLHKPGVANLAAAWFAFAVFGSGHPLHTGLVLPTPERCNRESRLSAPETHLLICCKFSTANTVDAVISVLLPDKLQFSGCPCQNIFTGFMTICSSAKKNYVSEWFFHDWSSCRYPWYIYILHLK